MKSIYLNEEIHRKLKLLAALEKTSITLLVENFLTKDIQKKMSDLPTEILQELSAKGGSFDFLNHPNEDIYTLEDGEAV